MRSAPVLGAMVAVALALAACAPAAPTHDKAFYAANTDARAQTLTACQADPGRLGRTADCTDARAAEADAHAARFYAAPRPASRVVQPGQL
jgi:hypothetical protein